MDRSSKVKVVLILVLIWEMLHSTRCFGVGNATFNGLVILNGNIRATFDTITINGKSVDLKKLDQLAPEKEKDKKKKNVTNLGMMSKYNQ